METYKTSKEFLLRLRVNKPFYQTILENFSDKIDVLINSNNDDDEYVVIFSDQLCNGMKREIKVSGGAYYELMRALNL